MTPLEFFLQGLGLAFSAIALPGPMQAYILSMSARQGWRYSAVVAFSPLLVDIPVIIITVFILGSLPPVVIPVIQLAGGLFLLWLAWGAWKQWRADTIHIAPIAADDNGIDSAAGDDTAAGTADAAVHVSRLRILLNGMAMNGFSPGPWLFWSTVNGPLLLRALDLSAGHAIGFLFGFYGTFVGGLVVLAVVLDMAGRVNPHVNRGLVLFSVLLLLVFGVVLVAQSISSIAAL